MLFGRRVKIRNTFALVNLNTGWFEENTRDNQLRTETEYIMQSSLWGEREEWEGES